MALLRVKNQEELQQATLHILFHYLLHMCLQCKGYLSQSNQFWFAIKQLQVFKTMQLMKKCSRTHSNF